MTNIAFLTVLILPPAVLLVLWFLVRSHPLARAILAGLWVILLIILGFFGRLQWQSNYEVSITASTAFATAPIWFLGPVLIWTLPKGWKPIISVIATFLLPLPSLALCIILMMFTGNIWGM